MSSSSPTVADPPGTVIRYSSNFMRALRNSDAAKDVPQDIIRRYQQAEFYNAKQQFDPDQIGSTVNRLARDIPLKTDTGGRENVVVSKDDASLQPQQRQSWTRGCGASIQPKPDSQSSTQGNSSGMSSSKLQQNAGSNVTSSAMTSGRQPGLFPPGNRGMANALPPQPNSLRTGTRAFADFGQGYAITYKPPREPQEFRQNRPPFGRGRGAFGGRAQEDYDMPAHSSNRFPPPLFQQQQGLRQGNYGGGFGRGGGFTSSRRHAQSTGDSVPEWFTEGPSDPSMMIELGRELPTSSRSSSPAESLGDESVEDCKHFAEHNSNTRSDFSGADSAVTAAPNVTITNATTSAAATVSTESIHTTNKQAAGWQTAGEKDRPASQQADFTYLLWSSLQNDLSSSFGELGSRNGGTSDAVPLSAAEITGSKLWSVWKDDVCATGSGVVATSGALQDDSVKGVSNPLEGNNSNKVQWHNAQPLQPQSQDSASAYLLDWLENSQMAERKAGAIPQLQRPSGIPPDPSVLRVATVGDSNNGVSGSATSPAPRGLNPVDLFAKFSISNGANSSINAVSAAVTQPAQPASVSNVQTRKSPPVTQMMSVEDLERKLMMKKQAAAKVQQPGEVKSQESDREHLKHSSATGQQKSFYDVTTSGQQSHTKASISDDNNANLPPPLPQQQQQQHLQQPQFTGQTPAALQMQLAAAHQAVMNAVAAANSSGGAGGTAALQQQKLFANLLLQQQQQLQAPGNTSSASSSTGNNGGTAAQLPPGLPPFFNMFPPNVLTAAAMAASSPLFYYPQLLQQAQQVASRMPGANNNSTAQPMQPQQQQQQQQQHQQLSGGNPPVSSGTTTGNVPLRPPFPMPPPGAFPNFPALNPTAAANLMANLMTHFQQQQSQQHGKSSPGPGGTPCSNTSNTGLGSNSIPFNNPQMAACAMAAATALASRMGLNPHGLNPVPPSQPQGQPTFQSACQFPSQPMQNNPSNNQQQQMPQRPPPPESPPRMRASSPTAATTISNSSSSKLGTSFIPTQVMMKNPHTINSSSPDTSASLGKTPTQVTRTNINLANAKLNSGRIVESSGAPQSYSSVTANNNTNTNMNNNGQPLKSNLWTAEDLERPFMKTAQSRDTPSTNPNNYSSYPPLHQQLAASGSQRTAGIAAATSVCSSATGNGMGRFQEQTHRTVETAHQFSVADLLRGAANANAKAAQSSSAGYT